MSFLIAIDPGIKKCGVLLVDSSKRKVIEGRVVKSRDVVSLLQVWIEQKSCKEIYLGNGTSSDQWEMVFSKFVKVQLIDERGTTLRARKRYWELWPPTKLQRLIPLGLLIPPDDLDALAALVMLEDYLHFKFIWEGPIDFKNEL